MSSRTIVLAVGGASSSVQPYPDTIWQASRDAIARSGRTDVEYVEVNSAGASRHRIGAAIYAAISSRDNLIAVLKSHGGDEFLDALRAFNDPPKIPRLAVILCDVHSLNRRKLWWGPPPSRWNLINRARYSVPTITPEWKSISVESHWTSISQFNRKPYGTKFEGADVMEDLTYRHLFFDADGKQVTGDYPRIRTQKLVDHFNISHSPDFYASLDHALWWTA